MGLMIISFLFGILFVNNLLEEFRESFKIII